MYQKKLIDPLNPGRFSLSKLEIHFASNRDYKISADEKHVKNYFTVNCIILWPCLLLKEV